MALQHDVHCGMVHPDPPAPGRWARLRRGLREIWLIPVVALFLTTIFVASDNMLSFKQAPWVLWINLVASSCIGGTLIAAYAWIAPWIRNQSPSRVARLGAHVVSIAGAVFGGSELAIRVLQLASPRYLGISRLSLYMISGAVCTTIVLVVRAYERIVGRAREIELREAQARRGMLTAQLEALQARTNPHFLFNSLNAVASLIEEDPKRAEAMLERLASLFRYALEGSRRQHVPLRDEMTAVRTYLAVEAERFGARLTSTVDVEPGLEELAVPPLVLQPLVENAVLHGIAARREGGRVDVSARRENGTLVLTVEDDGPGPGASPHQGTRTALDDLRQRLELAYGAAATLVSSTGENGGCRVRLSIPIAASTD